MTQGRFDWPADPPDWATFLSYHQENPAIYAGLLRYARQAVDAGRTHLSIKALWERLRWDTYIGAAGDTFKLNNNWHAYYARLLMAKQPELAGLFETRQARADQEEP